MAVTECCCAVDGPCYMFTEGTAEAKECLKNCRLRRAWRGITSDVSPAITDLGPELDEFIDTVCKGLGVSKDLLTGDVDYATTSLSMLSTPSKGPNVFLELMKKAQGKGD